LARATLDVYDLVEVGTRLLGFVVSRSRFLLLALACASVAAVAGKLAGRATRTAQHAQPAPPPPAEQLSRKSIPPAVTVASTHVGEVWESETARVSVRLVNTTDRRLNLTHIGGNCNCTQVSPSTALLEPRAELEASLTYDLNDRTPPDFGKLEREFKIVLSLEVNGLPQKPFLLTGTCRSHLATDTTVLHFGESNVRGQAPVSRYVRVNASPQVATVRASSNPASVRVSAPERTARGWRVAITPEHAQSAAAFEATVRFEALNAEGAVLGESQVHIDGTLRDAPTREEGAHVP
jgi:hypothetical protein